MGRDGSDRLESIDSGRGGGQGEGPIVRGAGHPDLTSRPFGPDLIITVGRREGTGPAIEPIDHRLRGERFLYPSDCGTALGETRTRRLGVDDREPARDPVTDMRVRDPWPDPLLDWRLIDPRARLLIELLPDIPEILTPCRTT